MAYELPSYTLESNVVLTNPYVFIHDVMVNFTRFEGHATFGIHPTENDWTAKPADSILVSLGETFENGEKMPTYEEFMSIPEVAQAINVIGYHLYFFAKKHPKFQQATIIPPS